MFSWNLNWLLPSVGEMSSQTLAPSLQNIVLCRRSYKLGPNNKFSWSARGLEIEPEPLICLPQIREQYPGLFDRKDLRIGPFKFVQDGNNKLVASAQPNNFWHVTHPYNPMRDDHRIDLSALFDGFTNAEIIQQLTTMFLYHVLPNGQKQDDFNQIGVDGSNAEGFMTLLCFHAKKQGRLVLMHNPGDFALLNPNAPDVRNPAKKSCYFAVEVPPSWFTGPSGKGKAKSNKRVTHLFFILHHFVMHGPV